MGPQEVTLMNICGGAAAEVFAREFAQVLKNIDDPNTAPEAARKVVLAFELKPLPDRTGATVTFSCGSKLAPVAVSKGTIFLGREGAAVKAYSADVKQQQMFGADEKPPKLVVLDKQ